MRPHSLFLLYFLLSTQASAQFNAGDVPPGTSTLDPGINLQLSQPFTMTSEVFDVDCDGTPDFRASLFQGNPAIDAPNHCQLELLDSSLTLCADMDPFYWRPHYYNFGQGLVCPAGFSWRDDTATVLGQFGGFVQVGPWDVDSMYVAYQKGADLGWILLSFDLTGGFGGQPIFLQIHQALQQCLPNSINEQATTPVLQLHPNTTHGAPISIVSPTTLQRIELLDATGRVVARYAGDRTSIPAPARPGTYLLRAVGVDGRSMMVRFAKY